VRQTQSSSFITNLYVIVLHLLYLLSKSVNECSLIDKLGTWNTIFFNISPEGAMRGN
jgi:hypothetical protein